MSNQAVFGIVGSRSQAEIIIQDLMNVGISQADISILSSSQKEFLEFNSRLSDEKIVRQDFDRPVQEQVVTADLATEKHTKAPEGTAIGATAGGVIGGTIGLLAGIGALAIPGLGPFIAAGPLMAFFSGLGIGGLAGGVVGALSGLGVPEYEAKNYENRLKEGGILVSVVVYEDNSDLVKRVKEIMLKDGAKDIAVTSVASASKENRRVA